MWPVLVLSGLVTLAGAQYETCYANDPDPYVHYGTKTAYEFVSEKNTHQHNIPNCEPVMFWALNRPGARLPTAKRVQDLKNLEQFQKPILLNYDTGAITRVSDVRLCQRDVDNLRAWRWKPRGNYTPEDLTTQGYMDTQALARAWRSRYPTILTDDPKDYLFKYVKDRGNANSFQAYTEGLFGQRASTISIPQEHDETLLQPFKRCAAWSKDVELNNDTMRQVDIFTSKLEFKEMIKNVSSRLGFSNAIGSGAVQRMWEMCRLDKAWDLTMPSPWCAAFKKEDLKLLEYIEDLKSYYGSGYGSSLNTKLGCAPVKDMYEFFSKYVNYNQMTPPRPKAVIAFAPSAQLLMTLTAMGAYQDTVPLTGDNYNTRLMKNRVWRTSEIDPFGANLVAVLYRCRDQGEQFRVMFFQNERPINMIGCPVGLCDWSWIKARFGHVSEKCDVKAFCKNSGAIPSVNLLAILAVLFSFMFNRYIIY